ncbi:MAG: hypothetical protein H2057_01420 [Alphaproteobacteria bacterium]|nr:hypothetical protein [Alphaproteobacteria bacterium]
MLTGITPAGSLQEAWRLLKTKKTSLVENFLALGAKNLSLEEQKNPSPDTIEKRGQALLGYMKDMDALVEGNTDPWVMATVLYFKTLLIEASDAAYQPLLLEIFRDILSHPNTNENLYIPFFARKTILASTHSIKEPCVRPVKSV